MKLQGSGLYQKTVVTCADKLDKLFGEMRKQSAVTFWCCSQSMSGAVVTLTLTLCCETSQLLLFLYGDMSTFTDSRIANCKLHVLHVHQVTLGEATRAPFVGSSARGPFLANGALRLLGTAK